MHAPSVRVETLALREFFTGPFNHADSIGWGGSFSTQASQAVEPFEGHGDGVDVATAGMRYDRVIRLHHVSLPVRGSTNIMLGPALPMLLLPPHFFCFWCEHLRPRATRGPFVSRW